MFYSKKIIFVGLIICSCNVKSDSSRVSKSAIHTNRITKDFGYGEEEVNDSSAATSAIVKRAFSYDDITSKKRIGISEITNHGDTTIRIGREFVFFSTARNSIIFADSLTKIKGISNSIYLVGKLYSLDSLYYNSKSTRKIQLIITSCFILSFNQSDYMVLYITPLGNSTAPNHLGIIIELSNGFAMHKFPQYQPSNSVKCFRDFNDDGVLDYLGFDPNKNLVHLYSFNSGSFIFDKDHYIKLEVLFGRYFQVNKEKSKWFYQF